MWDGRFAASRRILEVFGKQDEEVKWGYYVLGFSFMNSSANS
jgi:hypothetical protein